MKITLLGAGHIGSTIARLLHNTGDYDVLLADRDALSLEAVQDLGIKTSLIDSSDPKALQAIFRSRDAVINALPYQMAITVAQAAKSAGVHYFDLTEDVHATKVIKELAKNASTTFMPQCGLAPGFIGIAAYALSQRFDQLFDLKMRVGALPQFPTNALKYNLTWSIDGLINEYCQPCEAILEGQPGKTLPLEGLENFSVDGVEYEAFNTSGGLGTLCDTLAGKVRNLNYKTVRYPGHCALMRFLLEDLELARQPEQLKNMLHNALPATTQDLVLVFISASGLRQGKLVQEVFSRKILASKTNGSAIQIATASGICAAVDLFREKRLPQAGFISQESIALDDFLRNRFGQAYNLGAETSTQTTLDNASHGDNNKTGKHEVRTHEPDDQALAPA